MRRRDFIGLVGSAAAWPVVAVAQQPTRMPVVGVLWHGTREKELANPYYHWVLQGFEDVGLKPGINIHLDHQFADESDARYRVLAPQMAALKPDVLLAIALPPTPSRKCTAMSLWSSWDHSTHWLWGSSIVWQCAPRR